MAIQHDPGLQIYVAKRDIPPYQRDWVWGFAVLFVFLCGLLTGWVVKPNLNSVQQTAGRPTPESSVTEDALARQEALNQQLHKQITRLETLLSSEDVCSAEAVATVQRVLKAIAEK